MFGVTTEQPKRGLCNWAYCTRKDAAGRWAVGHVRATSEAEAKKKARAKAERMTAKVLGYKNITAMRNEVKRLSLLNGRKPQGFARRVFVWRDDNHECNAGTAR